MSVIDDIEYKKEHRELLDSNFSFNSAWYTNQKSYILASAIRISYEIFPDIYNLLNDTVSKIDTKSKYEFFITSDNAFNAKCISISEKSAIIVINSKVIELLETNELAFIVGHEIAHHYYKHYSFMEDIDNISSEKLKLAYLSVSRDMELSCDRLGLICVDNFEVAAKAIIKIVSGLSDKFIKNNFKKYLSQLKEISHSGLVEEQYQTHNNWLIRLQCLYLFSNSDIYNQYINNTSKSFKNISTINKLIEDGLSNLTQSKNYEQFSKQSNDMFCWLLLYLVHIHDSNLLDTISKKLNGHNQTKINKINKYLLNNSLQNIEKKINSLVADYRELPLAHRNETLKKVTDFLEKNNVSSNIIESKFESVKKELT